MMGILRWLDRNKTAVAVVALALAVLYFYHRANALERERNIAQANNRALVAAVYSVQVALLQQKDSVRAYAQAVQQQQITLDSLSAGIKQVTKDLKLTQRAFGTLQARFDSVLRTREDTPPVVAGERTLTDTLAGPPIEGTITATAPVDTLHPMRIASALRISPFRLSYAIGCERKAPHTAYVSFDAPTWVRLIPEPAQVDPVVCQGEESRFLGLTPKTTFWIGAGLGIGVTALISHFVDVWTDDD